HGAVVRLEVSLEDERPGPIAARARADFAGRCNEPPPVDLVPEERREARGRVEPRQAQPVDGTVAANERGRLHIADQPVILDPHGPPLVSAARGRTLLTCRLVQRRATFTRSG